MRRCTWIHALVVLSFVAASAAGAAEVQPERQQLPFRVTRQLANVTVTEAIKPDLTTSLHVTFERPPTKSHATQLTFAYRAPLAKEPLIAVHYLP